MFNLEFQVQMGFFGLILGALFCFLVKSKAISTKLGLCEEKKKDFYILNLPFCIKDETWDSRHRALPSNSMKKYIIEGASFRRENGNRKLFHLQD